MPPRRIVAVYDSDRGFVGDLKYIVRKTLRGKGCAMCDITHRLVRVAPAWKRIAARSRFPIETRYRDELQGALAETASGEQPCVVAETDDEPVLVLRSRDLERCGGDPDRFEAELQRAIARLSSG